MTDLSTALSGFPSDLTSGDGAILQELFVNSIQNIINRNVWSIQLVDAPFAASLLYGSLGTVPGLQKVQVEPLFALLNSVLDNIITNSGAVCYYSPTTDQFLSIVSNVVTSLKTTQFSSIVSSTFKSTLDKITKCEYEVLVCGISPYQFTSNDFSYSLGYSDELTTNQFCGFNVSSFGSLTNNTSPCIKYECQSTVIDGLLPKAKYSNELAFGNTTVQLYFYDESTPPQKVSMISGNISGSIPLSSNLMSQYQLGVIGSGFYPVVVKLNRNSCRCNCGKNYCGGFRCNYCGRCRCNYCWYDCSNNYSVFSIGIRSEQKIISLESYKLTNF